ncbi:MAG: type I-E CRISPR-associated protein Cas7/Cse4/CasC [Dehalococcoidia bacterium]|nr:type I-E CRISPR-associated protein Cas7/Cse4/CasC [Dehalococcoidia bacterium]
MTTPKFIQLHTLTSYPSALLNRDDVGFAKRIPFGGAVRTRVSSQCLKRHWRTYSGPHALAELGEPSSIRSRRTFEEFVVGPLLRDGLPETAVRAVTAEVMKAVLGESKKAKAKGEEGEDKALATGQVTVLGQPEVEYLKEMVGRLTLELEGPVVEEKDAQKAADKAVKDFLKANKGEIRKNLEALRRASGLDAALFGRMVTSDILSRGDAAIHVAHALTVHAEESETDYFSAVDDLLAAADDDAGELGSGHIGQTELTSGLYYGYVVVDVPLLVSNLEGCARAAWRDADRGLAARVVESLLHTVTKVSPGAKLGSTAPYAYAHCLMVELGDEQPRTLANAFLEPVDSQRRVLGAAYDALGRYVGELDRAYGRAEERRLLGIGDIDRLAERVGVAEAQSLTDIAAWATHRLMEG